MKIKLENLTPHIVRLNDGREFPPSGTVARVSATYSAPVDDICRVEFGSITGLPPAELVCGYCGQPGCGMLSGESICCPDPAWVPTRYIVSGMVAQAARRADVVSPGTGHPDCRREKGQVVSVPCFVGGGGL